MPRPKKFRNIRVLKENISFKPYDDEVTEFVEIFKDLNYTIKCTTRK